MSKHISHCRTISHRQVQIFLIWRHIGISLRDCHSQKTSTDLPPISGIWSFLKEKVASEIRAEVMHCESGIKYPNCLLAPKINVEAILCRKVALQ